MPLVVSMVMMVVLQNVVTMLLSCIRTLQKPTNGIAWLICQLSSRITNHRLLYTTGSFTCDGQIQRRSNQSYQCLNFVDLNNGLINSPIGFRSSRNALAIAITFSLSLPYKRPTQIVQTWLEILGSHKETLFW